MKKITRRIGIVLAAAVMMLSFPLTADASDEKYTYNYDWWGDVQDSPDAYTVVGVYTAVDLGLEQGFSNPSGLFAQDDTLYLCDTGNNRILEIKRTALETYEVVRIIDSFKGGSGVNTLSGPTDIAVSLEGDIYIADKGNARVLKLDNDLNYIMEFNKPDDSALNDTLDFLPGKIVIDTAGRVYCTATGVNQGLIKYEADGQFSGFVGATKVTYDWTDYIWKRLATEEQRAQMASFVPTEYDNIYIDHEGFIYATNAHVTAEDLDSESADAIRKLNLMGNDVLVRNGAWPVYGDLYMGEGGGFDGPSLITDITVMDNDVYVGLDRNRGRLFGYDDQGRMLFAFGSNGNMDGYFRRPTAIEHIGHDLYVLDSQDCSLTVFTPTEFGSLVYQAIEEFDDGKYTESGETWQKVMDINGNYDLAYIGLGRSLLRQERYHEAMEYFELKLDEDNYSRAYKQYRKEWVEEHIVVIVVVILALFLIPLSIGKVKKIKHEIEIADIFRT
ncbi:MAG: hypothetical protein NC432_10410 [Roseburia sp.]|nr:hypothetical protein [Roseburia sp.]MCM1097110.1 hypothetical protein [Ruminococcus flavefaciens]